MSSGGPDVSGVGKFKRLKAKQNKTASRLTYQRVAGATQSSKTYFMERLADKDTLFGPKGTADRGTKEAELSLFTPQKMRKKGNAWSPQINDAWLIGHLDKGNQGVLASPPTKENLWSAADNRPTATGREVLHTLDSGYSAVVGNENSPLGSKPMFMNPVGGGVSADVKGIDYVDSLSAPRQKATLAHLSAQHTVMEGHDGGGQILKDAYVGGSVTKRDKAPFPALYHPAGARGHVDPTSWD